jgi:hypothetical protein
MRGSRNIRRDDRLGQRVKWEESERRREKSEVCPAPFESKRKWITSASARPKHAFKERKGPISVITEPLTVCRLVGPIMKLEAMLYERRNCQRKKEAPETPKPA